MCGKGRKLSAGKTRPFWQAVFLDFDGVVVESADIKTEAFGRMFSSESLSARKRIARYHAEHMGVSRHVKFRHIYKTILRRPLGAAGERKLGRDFSRLVKDRVVNCPFVLGAERFLARWSDQAALHLVSGTPQIELRNIVAWRGLTKYFRGVYGSPRTKSDIVKELLRRGKYDRRRVVFVGDAMTDLREAARAEILFVGRAVRASHFHPFRPPVVQDLVSLDRWMTRSFHPEPNGAGRER